jgi:hypothetical protein
VSDNKRELQAVFDILKENYFHGAFEVWKKWRDHCIRSQGDYFEGDGSQNWVKPAFLSWLSLGTYRQHLVYILSFIRTS